MPTPADLLSEEDDEDPDDQLRMQLAQGQGANLAGAPQPPGQGGMPTPGQGIPGAMPPSPNVPGPLSALAKKMPGKPRIKLKTPAAPPRMVKRKKPHIRLKTSPTSSATSPLQGFLNSIGS